MTSAGSLLTECEGRTRVDQVNILRQLEALTIWVPTDAPTLETSFLVVAPWAQLDGEALTDYLELEGARTLALHDWFSTREELKSVVGYDGPCLQSPILVIRESSGVAVWQGEGYSAREKLREYRPNNHEKLPP